MITLWNYSDQDEDVLLTFLFEGGQYILPVHVPAKGFLMVDVGELIASQAPDSKGNKFPSTARQGSLNISNVSSSPRDRIHLTATAATFNVHTATCGEICDSCNGYDAIAISPSNFSDLLSKTVQLHSYAVLSGQTTAEVTDLTLWTSSDRSVATVSNGGLVTGVAPGGVLLDGIAFLPPSNKYCWDNNLNSCDNVYFEDTAEGTIGCGDNRGYLVKQYVDYTVTDITNGLRFSPVCSNFTASAHSQYFSFSEINIPSPNLGYPEYEFALVRSPLIAATSSGYGLDAWRTAYGNLRIINSGYRDPHQNQLAGGVAGSRHQFGDAADLRNQSGTLTEYNNMVRTAHILKADFVEPTNGPCGTACTHADWRNHGGGYAP